MKKINTYVNELANHVCHGMENSFYLVFDVGPHQTLFSYAHVLGNNNFNFTHRFVGDHRKMKGHH